MMKKKKTQLKKAMSGSPLKMLTSAVGHGRGHPAILLVGLDKALEGRLSFLATKGFLRLACFPADTTLKRKQHLEKSRFSSVKVLKHTEFNDLQKEYWMRCSKQYSNHKIKRLFLYLNASYQHMNS